MTWLVHRYLAAQTKLTLHRAGNRLEGRITDIADRPVDSAPIFVTARFFGGPEAFAAGMRSGRVPPNAASALFALRINAECNCSGRADVTLGGIQYRDDRSGQTVRRAFRSFSVPGGVVGQDRFEVSPGQMTVQNTSVFPVTANDPFTVRMPIRMDSASAGSGYVAIVFLDVAGNELERVRLPFAAVERLAGVPTTDPQGRFSLRIDPATQRAGEGFRAEYHGDVTHRLASATLAP